MLGTDVGATGAAGAAMGKSTIATELSATGAAKAGSEAGDSCATVSEAPGGKTLFTKYGATASPTAAPHTMTDSFSGLNMT